MTIKERILAALNWQEPDQIPLTIYVGLLPRGEQERRLRQMGVGLTPGCAAYSTEYRHVETGTTEYWEKGRKHIRRTIRTPVGEIYQILVPDNSAYGGADVVREHYVKGPDDYRVMEYYINDPVHRPAYDTVGEKTRILGQDGVLTLNVPKQPIQYMFYHMLGYERFAVDYFERRDLFDSLYHALAARDEKLYEITAGAPGEIVRLGANVSADVVGNERYREYLMPQYSSLRAKLQGTDKKVIVHMDGLLAPLSAAIAEAEFDVVEALTPPPMGDVSVAKARELWPDKALWINFPGPVLLEEAEVVADYTRELVQQAGSKRGFVMAITEDEPLEPLERSLEVIAQVLSNK